MTDLLSKDRTILERPFMEFRPFGVDVDGQRIRDVTGVSVRAMVDYMQQYVARTAGSEAVQRVLSELCRSLNERIRDPAYHVVPAFLLNPWNSYSYEFVCYVYELCAVLSGDQRFAFNAGKEKVSPIIQILGRPFSLAQIYRTYSHFAKKFTVGCIEYEEGRVTDSSAILRFRFTEHSYRQFGPYRRRCASIICQSHHGTQTAVPERVHHLPPAVVRDRTCIANGDEWCELEIMWPQPHQLGPFGRLRRALDGVGFSRGNP